MWDYERWLQPFPLLPAVLIFSDLPLLSVVGSQSSAGSFRLHWLNNKELQFTMEAERLLQELHANLQPVPDPQGSSAPDCSVGEDEAQDGDTEAGRNYVDCCMVNGQASGMLAAYDILTTYKHRFI